MKYTCLCVLALVAGVSAVYPATYPFENESEVPVQLPAATPSYTFDASDPGGYFYVYSYSAVLDESDFARNGAYAFTANGSWMYGFVVGFKAAPVLGDAMFNCTAKLLPVLSSADFVGTVNSQKVCEAGSCCASSIGLPKFGEDQMVWQQWIVDKSSAGICGDITEELYCLYIQGHSQINCFEYVLSPTERLETFACIDVAWNYWLTCGFFKQSGVDFGYVLEPPMYIDLLSAEQTIVHQSVSVHPDHICHPTSYYEPASETSGGTTKDEKSTDEKSSTVYTTFVAALVLSAL